MAGFSEWKMNLSNFTRCFVGRTTRSALIVKSEVNTVFDSSLTKRKLESKRQRRTIFDYYGKMKANDSFSGIVQFVYEMFNITEITETHSEM